MSRGRNHAAAKGGGVEVTDQPQAQGDAGHEERRQSE